tara:strand:- start:235 stop:510 length:276 start_codon:yes stop_codon:yes gene_type:complete
MIKGIHINGLTKVEVWIVVGFILRLVCFFNFPVHSYADGTPMPNLSFIFYSKEILTTLFGVIFGYRCIQFYKKGQTLLYIGSFVGYLLIKK